MKKVFQTIVDKGKGNCMQAAIASLLEKSMNEVPDFNHLSLEANKEGKGGYWFLFDYMESLGYEYDIHLNPDYHANKNLSGLVHDNIFKALKNNNEFSVFFYARIESKTFPDTGHAVIVDRNLKVVHDPNPNGLSLESNPCEIDFILEFQKTTNA
ncbi:MAG: hypothetical protein ABJG33_00140 [Balneola sp.]